MKWNDERDSVLARLTELEARVATLESRPSTDPTGPADPAGPVDPVTPVTPVAPVDPVSPAVSGRDSALDSAWSAIMAGDPGVQVAIVNKTDPRYNGGPFVVEDNKEEVKGEGDSVAAAFAAYVASGGKRHGDSSPLDDFEYGQAEFFSTPANVRAPSSCRHSNQGFECDFFRQGVTIGNGDKVGPFAAPGLAIEAMRAKLGSDL